MKQFKKHITFNGFLLFLLTVTVLWLIYKTNNISSDNTAYMRNQTSRFTVIKTEYGSFPVTINETKPVAGGTELSLILINPLNVHFVDAEISVHTYTAETIKMNLVPGANSAQFKIPSIEPEHPIKITLSLKRVYFK